MSIFIYLNFRYLDIGEFKLSTGKRQIFIPLELKDFSTLDLKTKAKSGGLFSFPGENKVVPRVSNRTQI